MLVQERARRANAGNRMQELLAQAEWESEDMFAEAENDVEFEEREDEHDVVDSDFDGNSTEEGSDEDVEAEESLAREEKRQKKAQRPAVMSLTAAPKPAGGAAPRRRAPRTTPTVLPPGGTRSSTRRSTVENKMATQTKLQEAEARRASAKARPVKRVKHMTQDALIREALEMEEENTQSLLHYLEQEEERKARQRQAGKKVMHGPFVRWISVGLDQNVFGALDAKDKPSGEKADDGARREPTYPTAHSPTEEPSRVHDASTDQPRAGAPSALTPQEATSANIVGGDAPEQSKLHEASDQAHAPAQEEQQQGLDERGDEGTAQPASSGKLAGEHVTTPAKSDEAASSADAAPHQSHAPEPPVVEAGSDTQHTDTPRLSGEITARTILSLHGLEADATWVDEFRYLLGEHCAWDRLPFVPSRNRPFRPRQSTCVITGLPARYRDPRTGIPYATADAYATLTRVLDGEFRWTGLAQRGTALSAGLFASAMDDCGAGGVFVRR